jgi:hypothetical protein
MQNQRMPTQIATGSVEGIRKRRATMKKMER